MITEEAVTKTILGWLEKDGWEIISYDFPQSGTGINLKKNDCETEKNKGDIIPDIIAVRNGVCIFAEDKDHYDYSDYKKVNNLRTSNDYTDAIDEVLSNRNIYQIYYGIGLYKGEYKSAAKENEILTDFVLTVDDLLIVKIEYNPNAIF